MNPLCEQCGGLCCRNVARPVEVRNEEDRRWYELRGRIVDGVWFIRSECDHLCVGMCMIYEHRPERCRTYPVNGPDCRRTRAAFGKA